MSDSRKESKQDKPDPNDSQAPQAPQAPKGEESSAPYPTHKGIYGEYPANATRVMYNKNDRSNNNDVNDSIDITIGKPKNDNNKLFGKSKVKDTSGDAIDNSNAKMKDKDNNNDKNDKPSYSGTKPKGG